MSKVSFSIEDWLEILTDFENCSLKPLLHQILQTEVAKDNITFFNMILTMIEKHEAELRVQRQELSSVIMKYEGKQMISKYKAKQ